MSANAEKMDEYFIPGLSQETKKELELRAKARGISVNEHLIELVEDGLGHRDFMDEDEKHSLISEAEERLADPKAEWTSYEAFLKEFFLESSTSNQA